MGGVPNEGRPTPIPPSINLVRKMFINSYLSYYRQLSEYSKIETIEN